MIVLRARNVHQALPKGVDCLVREGVKRDSRNGPVYEHPEPVTTVYDRPCERVLFWPARDANPFFHLFESLHMLAGRRDVAWLSRYNARIKEYSDDGAEFHGAYGYRWRTTFDVDQLSAVAVMLGQDPDSRRAVVQMWHAPLDLGTKSRDLPCNTHAYFKVRDGALLMTVCCRSNDIVWGAYGANAVHFSFLQEYLSDKIGVTVGPYTQVSDSFHAYEGVWERVQGLPQSQPCPYETGAVAPFALNAADEGWDLDLSTVFSGRTTGFRTSFFSEVIHPLLGAYEMYKAGDFGRALRQAAECRATDWSLAAIEWLKRRPSYQGESL